MKVEHDSFDGVPTVGGRRTDRDPNSGGTKCGTDWTAVGQVNAGWGTACSRQLRASLPASVRDPLPDPCSSASRIEKQIR